MSELLAYFQTLWKDTDCYVYLPYRTPEGVWRKAFAKWPEQQTSVVNHVLAQTAKGNEIYIGPAMFKIKPTKDDKLNNGMILGSWVLWADFDGNAPESWEGITLPAAVGGSAADSAPPLSLPAPTMRIQTSMESNQHAYWQLDEMVTDTVLLENMNRTLALAAKADTSGWDALQVLRPPDSTNFGYTKSDRGGKTYPVVIEELDNTKVYNQSAFTTTVDFRPLVKESLNEVPKIQDVLAMHKWPETLYKAFTADVVDKGRSDQLMSVAYLAAESGFSQEEMYSVLIDCDDRWKKYTGRTDRDKRIVDIIERAKAKHPTGLTELTFDGLFKGSTTNEEVQTLFGFQEFIDTDVKIEWFFDGLLSTGGYGIIAGAPNIGKTQLALRLAEAVCAGNGFLNWENKLNKHGKVVFFSLEMNHVTLKHFYTSMGNDIKEEDLNANFSIVPLGEHIPLDREEGRKFFEAIIGQVKPDLVIVDSLSKITTGSLSQDEVVYELNNYLNGIRKKYGCSMLVVHHDRKQQDKKFKNVTLDDLYGSRFLSSDADFVLLMIQSEGEDRNDITIIPAKTRFSATIPDISVKRTDTLNFTVETEVGEINTYDYNNFDEGRSSGGDSSLGFD